MHIIYLYTDAPTPTPPPPQKNKIPKLEPLLVAFFQSLIRSKHRANISVALTPEVASPQRRAKLRPSSAPGTKLEADLAHWSAGETDHLHKQEEFIRPDPVLPPEDPETERIRQELLATNVRQITKEDLLNSFAL